jgi:guanosine-3',5'-bis(diphosphate) 3'-pyrophosphohydrolase
MLNVCLKAVEFAVVKHNGQFRKGSGAEPYVVHPIGVAKLLAMYGLDNEAIIAAALLHDVMEDCGVTYEELTKEFGQAVANAVRELTDVGEYQTIKDRKAAQAEKMKTASVTAKLVKIADQFDNVEDAYFNPAVGWSYERRIDYINAATAVVEAAAVGLVTEPAERMIHEYHITAEAAIASIEAHMAMEMRD